MNSDAQEERGEMAFPPDEVCYIKGNLMLLWSQRAIIDVATFWFGTHLKILLHLF